MREHIWANHAHVFPEKSKEGATVNDLKNLMAECGIEKAVCFTCFRDQFERSGLSGDSLDWLYSEIKNDNSLIGFGTVDFERDDIEYQIDKMLSYGFKGIKIHPAAQEINVMLLLSLKKDTLVDMTRKKLVFMHQLHLV